MTCLALGGVVLVAGGAWFVNRVVYSPLADAPLALSPALIEKGEYVARLGDCVACHSVAGNPPFSGGLEMATPMGSIFATNITPDKRSGIGNYSLDDFDRAVRQGVAADGHRLYPAMPYPSFSKFSDDDVKALYAFFMKGVTPADVPNKQSEIPWPFNMRWPLALWNAAFADSDPYQAKPGQDEQWNRGAYIVQGPGHCGSCHTPRSITMNEKALDERNANYLSGALIDGWYAPSLRQDPNTGLGRWSEPEIVQYLKTGRNVHSVVTGSMTEAFNNSTQYMSDDDLGAIAHYLASLPGNGKDGPPWTPSPAPVAWSSPGAKTYLAKCSSCHGQDGRGQGQWIPPLAGASSSMVSESSTGINATLNGSDRVIASGLPDAYRMPPYRNQLTDQEIADALTFVRSSWGNQGNAVEANEVRTLRDKTDPASPDPIILHMR
ncbi:c-type cytochrome [Pseudomonas graminis]|uniref:Alcohol dehydrogenase n=1 Tax=Pseudomonas graminis TaxID=158627 RepID=A0A1C2DRV7_9PSED|nr:cytochrome c [Pseudomonas graminis]OCX17497.1 alcohol dehydrogenase [Pseudomonas graminis]